METKQANPTTFEHGDPWRYVNQHGVARRYEVDRTAIGPPGLAVFLTCLESPHEPIEGYAGGLSREARMLATSMRQQPAPGVAGWLPGHS